MNSDTQIKLEINISELLDNIFNNGCVVKVKFLDRYKDSDSKKYSNPCTNLKSYQMGRSLYKTYQDDGFNTIKWIGDREYPRVERILRFHLPSPNENKIYDDFYIDTSRDYYFKIHFHTTNREWSSNVDFAQYLKSINLKRKFNKLLNIYKDNKGDVHISRRIMSFLIKHCGLIFSNKHGFDGEYIQITDFYNNNFMALPIKRRKELVDIYQNNIWERKSEIHRLQQEIDKLQVKIENKKKIL